MIDGHIHIERGDYSLEWIEQFVNKAVEMKIDEIWLLEHCYIFEEFISCLLYTSPSPRDPKTSRMPSSA